jgi:hypothetical protein
LSIGAIRRREKTGRRKKTDGGIAFKRGTLPPFRWVCFVEGKGPERDCDFSTEHDWLRNQLERDIESLVTFQDHGTFLDRLYFTRLTPRLCKRHPRSRLYGYRMKEYLQKPALLLPDINRCAMPKQDDGDQEYPLLTSRLECLKLTWVSYEDISSGRLDYGTWPFSLPKDTRPWPATSRISRYGLCKSRRSLRHFH